MSLERIHEVQDASLRERLGAVGTAIGADYQESPNKPQNLAVGAGLLALQGLDRLRASVVFVPTIAVNVLESTQSPTIAALAGGAAFAGWCTAVGGITNEGLHQYPKAVSEFESNFPGVVDFFSDALPGVDLPTPEEKAKMSLARRIGNRVLTGLKRGYTVSGIGTVAYVSTSVVKGEAKASTHKLNIAASLDGGGAIGGVIFAIGEAITHIAQSNPELAERIQDTASNIKLWYAVAGAMIVGQFASNRFKKFKLRKQKDQENLTEAHEQLEDVSEEIS